MLYPYKEYIQFETPKGIQVNVLPHEKRDSMCTIPQNKFIFV